MERDLDEFGSPAWCELKDRGCIADAKDNGWMRMAVRDAKGRAWPIVDSMDWHRNCVAINAEWLVSMDKRERGQFVATIHRVGDADHHGATASMAESQALAMAADWIARRTGA